jgi:hypothetical protein
VLGDAGSHTADTAHQPLVRAPVEAAARRGGGGHNSMILLLRRIGIR